MWLLKDLQWQYISDKQITWPAPSVPHTRVPLTPGGCQNVLLQHLEWKHISREQQPPMKKLPSPLAFGSCWETHNHGFLNVVLNRPIIKATSPWKLQTSLHYWKKINILFLISFWHIHKIAALLMLQLILSYWKWVSQELNYMLFVYFFLEIRRQQLTCSEVNFLLVNSSIHF